MSRTTFLQNVVCLLVCSGASIASAQSGIWQPYVDMQGRSGSSAEVGQGNLFVPLWQDETQLLFADLRGQWTDVQSAEGNWGLAYRRILPSEWIVGMYGFCDLRHSQTNNNFQQVTLGVELLNVEWGFRANGYIPDDDAEEIPELNFAFLQGNNIVVRRGEERAYYGVDFEAERLLLNTAALDSCDGRKSRFAPGSVSDWLAALDAQLWATAGVYHFDNDATGFDNITGPRARAELRMYDLPLLGEGSRLVLSGQYEYDDVRGSVGTGMLTVRIPFGPGSSGRLSRLDRRMVTPIVRDIDIVSNIGLGDADPAKFADTGQTIGPVTVVDANTADVPGTVAGGTNTVVFDGSQGTINPNGTVVLNAGQFVGGQFEVIGYNTGARAVFGTRPTVMRAAGAGNIFQIANNSTLTGMNITGGTDGVTGTDVTGFMLSNLNISGASDDGVDLNGNNNGTIIDNTASENGDNGFEISTFSGGTISGNTASGNGEEGFDIGLISDGTVSGNTATGNTSDGFDIGFFQGGTFSGNTATGNMSDGFRISFFQGGTFSGNTATGNMSDGFQISFFQGGTISGNTASGNGEEGFNIGLISDGTVSGNTATGNMSDGFDIGFFQGGTFSGNTATGNMSDGFQLFDFDPGATFTSNSAINNTAAGYNITNDNGGTKDPGNTGSGNGSNDTFGP